MIQAKAYFEQYLGWKRHDKQNRVVYDSYATMPLDMLAKETAPGALEEQGERYLFGINTPADIDKALTLFQKAADAGHPDAWQMLAEIYRTDTYGRKDMERYFTLLPKAAELGNWKAMFNMAVACYRGKLAYDGYGFPMDHSEALKWTLQCESMCRELLRVFFGRTTTQNLKDYFGEVYDTYIRSIFAAAKQYVQGDGVEQSPQKAKQLVSEAQKFHRQYMGAESDALQQLLQKIN